MIKRRPSMTDHEWERIQREESCEHDYGGLCHSSPFGGCYRACLKCGQITATSKHCWELKAEREAAGSRGAE